MDQQSHVGLEMILFFALWRKSALYGQRIKRMRQFSQHFDTRCWWNIWIASTYHTTIIMHLKTHKRS